MHLIRRFWPLAAFTFCVLFFLAFPELDLRVSAVFYDQGFYWNQNPLVRLIYKIFAKIHILFLLLLIAYIVYFSLTHQRERRLLSVFMLVTLLLGPGVLVNLVLKDNSVGRPRPVHVQEFGGESTFTPVFYYSGECSKNCSFVSGHASIGFYFMSLFWVTKRRSWLLAGLAMGSAIGFVRIIQGGHFLSDVIFSGWAIYFVCEISAKLLLRKHSNSF